VTAQGPWCLSVLLDTGAKHYPICARLGFPPPGQPAPTLVSLRLPSPLLTSRAIADLPWPRQVSQVDVGVPDDMDVGYDLILDCIWIWPGRAELDLEQRPAPSLRGLPRQPPAQLRLALLQASARAAAR
jgi:hypothetical protein